MRFLQRLFTSRLPLPSFGQLLAAVSILGTGLLIFLAGAAVMHFQLPSSAFLRKAFWESSQLGKGTAPARADTADQPAMGIATDDPARTCDGFTLVTTTDGPWAVLIDMKGRIVQRWSKPFGEVWPQLSHVQYPLPEKEIHWFGAHLFPGGELLAVYHADGTSPYGYGLVKLDRDSKLIWAYADHVHHELDVGADGKIYALTQQITDEVPAGTGLPRRPNIADALLVLSSDGKKLDEVPILEALRDSDYALFLTLIDQGYLLDAPRVTGHPGRGPSVPVPPDGAPPPPIDPAKMDPRFVLPPPAMVPVGADPKGDFTHANCVRVLDRKLAAKFPMFKEGQVMISLRNMDALIVLDIADRKVVWASRGLWRRQHSPQFLDNGHILLYDNAGSSTLSRLIEFDPATQAIVWSYAGENSRKFVAPVRGSVQRLANGNTLSVNPDKCRIFEVTPDKRVVWECFGLRPPSRSKNELLSANICVVRRFAENQLTFLKGDLHARP